MDLEEATHRLIERPSGIPGYRPQFWCAVCGRKAEVNKDLHCTEEGCPNLCHRNCLYGEAEYSCGTTAEHRRRADITDQVTFTTRDLVQSSAPPHPTPAADLPTPAADLRTPHADPTEREDLAGLSSEEKDDLIVSLRRELLSFKEVVKNYSEVIDELTEKRCHIVNTLSAVDTLIALRDSKRDTDRVSIASTARADKIDREWSEHLSGNVTAREWWAGVTRIDSASETVTDSQAGDTPASLPNTTLSSPSLSTQRTPTAVPPRITLPPPSQPNPREASPPPHPPSHPPQTTPSRPSPTELPSLTPPPPSSPTQRGPSPPPRRVAQPRSQSHSQETNQPPPQPQARNQQPPRQRRTPPRRQGQRNRADRPGDRPAGGNQGGNWRQRQINKCSFCHRSGHTEDQCASRLTCDYCSGRFHTSQTCRERLADRRHQDLIEAVRLCNQETLAHLRGASWRSPPHAHPSNQQPECHHYVAQAHAHGTNYPPPHHGYNVAFPPQYHEATRGYHQ